MLYYLLLFSLDVGLAFSAVLAQGMNFTRPSRPRPNRLKGRNLPSNTLGDGLFSPF